MKHPRLIAALVLALVAAGLVLSLPAPAAAQGCAMCKLSAEAGGERTARTLDYGIFILLTPAVIIFLGVFYWAFTHRDKALADQREELRVGGTSSEKTSSTGTLPAT